jgi:hypothetical protein
MPVGVLQCREIGLFSGYAFAGAVLILVIAAVSHIYSGHRYNVNVLDSIGWGRIWMTVVAGIAVVVVELLMLK